MICIDAEEGRFWGEAWRAERRALSCNLSRVVPLYQLELRAFGTSERRGDKDFLTAGLNSTDNEEETRSILLNSTLRASAL
jgi:hypothetical protein